MYWLASMVQTVSPRVSKGLHLSSEGREWVEEDARSQHLASTCTYVCLHMDTVHTYQLARTKPFPCRGLEASGKGERFSTLDTPGIVPPSYSQGE